MGHSIWAAPGVVGKVNTTFLYLRTTERRETCAHTSGGGWVMTDYPITDYVVCDDAFAVDGDRTTRAASVVAR